MIKKIVQLAALTNIVAGQTAILDVPTGPRYHVIWLKTSAAAKTYDQILSEIRVKINNKIQRVHTALELNGMNALEGAAFGVFQRTGSTGAGNPYYVPIFFAEPWRGTQAEAENMAWATGDVNTFQLEIDLNAAAGTISLSAFCEADYAVGADNKPLPMGIISKCLRTALGVTGTTLNVLTFPKTETYQAMNFFDANISQIQIKVDNNIIRDVPIDLNNATLAARGMVPVNTRYDMVFDHDDVTRSFLVMEDGAGNRVKDFQVNLTLSDGTARNINCIYWQIGRPY